MMHDPADIIYKQLSGEPLTDAEAAALRDWAAQSPHYQAVIDEMSDEANVSAALVAVYETDKEALWRKIQMHRKPVRRIWLRYAAAAAVLLLMSTGIYFLSQRSPSSSSITIQHDVQPGSNKAVLTLGDGLEIQLDSLEHRTVRPGIQQSGGQLEYDAQHSASISYNTLSTPRGGQFSVVLPDGTKVWLNAASQLRYPTAFTGHNRKVEISGEAYFDVAKDSRHPFLVSINNKTEVQVLGTQFNINAYEDENGIRTTLIEGAVRMVSGTQQEILKPGQQAHLSNGTLSLASSVNTAQVIAWKNGVFDINDMRVDAVMRQLARWYDVEVIYENGVPPDIMFYGHIQRHLQLSQVLKILEKMDVHCRIAEGRKLIVK